MLYIVEHLYFSVNLFVGDPEPELAFIFQELAANDEYKQYLRIIVRRLMKTYRILQFTFLLLLFKFIYVFKKKKKWL